MVRGALLSIATHRFFRALATGAVGRKVALRFVAGEDLDDGLKAVKTLNTRGMTASLDHLGENVTDLLAARSDADAYVRALDRIESAGLQGNVSLKLTQMGLDVSREAAVENAARVVARAAGTGTTATLDMEDHRYTERTVEICLDLAARHPGSVGLALQSYLYRTPADLERVLHVPVRICKGAYLEPRDVSYRSKADVDRAFAHQVRRLLEAGAYPMIATHDERLVRFAQRIAERTGRNRETFEFQMLFGVRRDLQEQLVADGYRVRVYVPFGTEWYPYLVRRLAERPANLLFFISQLVRG